MKTITMVILQTSRDCYSLGDLGHTMTVSELIDKLKEFRGDMPVCFSNDNGYTYGSLSDYTVREKTERIDEEDY